MNRVKRSVFSVLTMVAASASLVAAEGTVLSQAQGGTAAQTESKGEAKSQSESGHKGSEKGIASQPPGIGEQGSGQAQSTKERSGGQERDQSQAADLSEGKTAQAMEEQVQDKTHEERK